MNRVDSVAHFGDLNPLLESTDAALCQVISAILAHSQRAPTAAEVFGLVVDVAYGAFNRRVPISTEQQLGVAAVALDLGQSKRSSVCEAR